MSVAAEVMSLYDRRGAGAYFGERVSMSEHGLQAAHFARVQGAPDNLVIAALLHDVGHLLEAVPDAIEEWVSDAHHEETGAHWLAQRFAADVAEPVRLHVPAKRYLCAVDPHYFAQLSAASVHTLKLQGGPMSPAEVARFEQEPYYREAVRVRHWDDQGKVAGLATPGLREYAGLIDALARIRSAAR
jgi:phosphonate degradation associated HDIG domain protein